MAGPLCEEPMMGCAFIVHSWSIETNAGQFKHSCLSISMLIVMTHYLSVMTGIFRISFSVSEVGYKEYSPRSRGLMVIVVKCRASGPGFDASFFSP